jgi:hypothetical protein
MMFADLKELGWTCFYGVAAWGFATIGFSSFKRAISDHRARHRIEMVRSVVIGSAMALAAAVTAVGAAYRLVALVR